MNRFIIAIVIIFVVLEQNSIIIKSEIHHNVFPSTSSLLSSSQVQQQLQQQQQQQQNNHHHKRHRNHNHHHHIQFINNLINSESNDNPKNNIINVPMPNNVKTIFELNNNNRNYIANDEEHDEIMHSASSSSDDINSMEFIGFDDDPIKNFNSEYSVNTNLVIVKNANNNNNNQDSSLPFHQQQQQIKGNHHHHQHSQSNHQYNQQNQIISNTRNSNENEENGDTSNMNIRRTISNSSSDSIRIISSDSDGTSSSNIIEQNSMKCPKCSASTVPNVRVSEEELIELRIEFVKNQILQKLRLKEKPKVPKNGLPKLLYEGTQIGIHNDENKSSKDLDDYYARTSQKFIFLEQEKNECYRTSRQQHPQYPSMCFSFKIDGVDVDGIDVNTAELWVYKRQSRMDKMKQTFLVSELYQGMNSKYLPKSKPIAIQSTGVEEGWIKFDIAWPIRKWFGNHDLNHIIEVSCQSCEPIDTHKENNLISADKDYTPFIIIDTMNRRQRRRQKRNVNCTAGVTECCREKLYISFEEIGWDDWIIQPSGYNAYFCRGSCSSAASITMSNTHHGSFLKKLLYQRQSNGKKPLELIPCCTAKQYSSLQLFYRDSNNTATLKTLPNMVVESCGCM